MTLIFLALLVLVLLIMTIVGVAYLAGQVAITLIVAWIVWRLVVKMTNWLKKD